MKEVNKPKQEEPIIEQKDPVIEVKLEELKKEELPKIEKAPIHRPYMGYKKEELHALLEKWRDMLNSVATLEDKDYSRKKIVELERELRKRP